MMGVSLGQTSISVVVAAAAANGFFYHNLLDS